MKHFLFALTKHWRTNLNFFFPSNFFPFPSNYSSYFTYTRTQSLSPRWRNVITINGWRLNSNNTRGSRVKQFSFYFLALPDSKLLFFFCNQQQKKTRVRSQISSETTHNHHHYHQRLSWQSQRVKKGKDSHFCHETWSTREITTLLHIYWSSDYKCLPDVKDLTFWGRNGKLIFFRFMFVVLSKTLNGFIFRVSGNVLKQESYKINTLLFSEELLKRVNITVYKNLKI